MKSSLVNLTYHIELLPGEKLHLPEALVESISEGRWVITVQPANASFSTLLRNQATFLHGFAPEAEGLYDPDPAE